MTYYKQSSFSGGELDPALIQRTKLNKYQVGLKTARNVYIGKTGRVVSRPGTNYFRSVKVPSEKSVIVAPPYGNYLIEWGNGYVREHNLSNGNVTETAHDFDLNDLPHCKFFFTGRWCYIFRHGKQTKKMLIGPIDIVPPYNVRFVPSGDIFKIPQPAGLATVSVISEGGTGTDKYEYVITVVNGGQESLPTVASSPVKRIVNAGERNVLGLTSAQPSTAYWNVYRRPEGGRAFGYIGSTAPGETTYEDVGEAADYTQSPPEPTGNNLSPIDTLARVGIIYQQRLIIANTVQNNEAIHASRVGFQNNFTRDFPITADSALTFKSGTEGNANVLWLFDNGPLLAFTTVGVFSNPGGALTDATISMDKQGSWVIDEFVPPLAVPGGLLFVDVATNTVRSLNYSQESSGYIASEVSIFSNHLFEGKRIVSWAFQDGDIPVIWTVFDDGSLCSFTYHPEHEMRAWTRHDTDGEFERVAVTKNLQGDNVIYFIIKRGTERIIERLESRTVLDVKQYVGMDSAYVTSINMNALGGGASFTLTADNAGEWDGPLTLLSDLPVFDSSLEGEIFRVFDKKGRATDLTVDEFVDSQTLKVTPDGKVPPENRTLPIGSKYQLYQTFNRIRFIGWLEGKRVSLLLDGNVISSPNNNAEDKYYDLVVEDGEIVFPDDLRAAFASVGLPYTCDVETLPIDKREDGSATIDGKIIPRVWISIHKTRGIYTGTEFPEDDKTEGMSVPELRTEDDPVNAPAPLLSETFDVFVNNRWDGEGGICIRQVDPLPMEILAITPDVEEPDY